MLLENFDCRGLETINKNEINLCISKNKRNYKIRVQKKGYYCLGFYQNPYFIYRKINKNPVFIEIRVGSIVKKLTIENKEMKKIGPIYLKESEELSIEVECSSQTAIRLFENAVYQKNRS